MAVLMAGKALAQGKSVLHEKVKFTVSVRGRQWSSARYVHETVEEFARIIQRNARRLDFIGENDRIQRLQLARADGSEPEELDVDATLEDVIICMGDKRLVAIIIPSRSPGLASGRREAEKCLSTTMALSSQSKSNIQNDDTPQSPNRYGFVRPMSMLPVKEIPSGIPGLKPVPVLFKRRVASREPPLRRLQITIPAPDPNPPTTLIKERANLAKDVNGEHEILPPPQPNSNRFNGAVVSKSNAPVALMSSKSTPSPAELAHFLVKGSSLPSNRSTTVNGSCNPFCSQYLGNSTPVPGFHSFAAALLRRLPVIPPTTMVCGSTPTDNIASTLAQFLASHLRAVVPGNNRVASCPPVSSHHLPHNNIDSSIAPVDVPGCSELEDKHCSHSSDKQLDGSGTRADCRCSSRNGTDEASVSGSQGKDKDDPSSPANPIVPSAPSNSCPKSESLHGRSELIFFVNRRSKTGVGAHHLKLSDLSIYFHLSVVDAAKKLGVSQTTLKKACRKFGLKRWPGRKVRSLESTIHGLEHTIAVGQGAGMEQLTEAYIRSEVTKLQQEMDQLVHGTLAQPPGTRSGDLYKRLYSRGWRSKYQSPSFNFDLNTDSQDNGEHVSSSQRNNAGNNGCKGIEESGVDALEHNSTNLRRQLSDPCSPPDYKWDHTCHLDRSKVVKNSNDSEISLDVGVRFEKYIGNCALGPDSTQNIVGTLIEKLAKDDTSHGVVELLANQGSFCERSPKRPKLGVN